MWESSPRTRREMIKKKQGGSCDDGTVLITRFLRHPLVPVGFVETHLELGPSILTRCWCSPSYNWLRFSRLIAPTNPHPCFGQSLSVRERPLVIGRYFGRPRLVQYGSRTGGHLPQTFESWIGEIRALRGPLVSLRSGH